MVCLKRRNNGDFSLRFMLIRFIIVINWLRNIKTISVCHSFAPVPSESPAMSTIPLSQLRKGAVAHIDSIVPNPVFGELDALVSRRLADLGFSGGMPLQVIAVGGFGRGPFAVRLGNQSQFSLRQEEAGKIMCHLVDAEQKQPAP